MAAKTHNPIPRVILYARSATGDGKNLEKQLAANRTWVRALGGEVLETFAEIAGGHGPCPQLERAIQAAQARSAALVCQRSDRLGRSPSLLLSRLGDCRRRRVPVFFADQGQPEEATWRLATILAACSAAAREKKGTPASHTTNKAATRQPKPAAGKKHPVRTVD